MRLITSTIGCLLVFVLVERESQAFSLSSNTRTHARSGSKFQSDNKKYRSSLNAVEERNDLQSGYDTERGYSSFLYSPKRKKRERKRDEKLQRLMEENDDGYSNMMKQDVPLWKRLLLKPLKFGYRGAKMMFGGAKAPGTLILVRHGESEWNANKTFTGKFQVRMYTIL